MIHTPVPEGDEQRVVRLARAFVLANRRYERALERRKHGISWDTETTEIHLRSERDAALGDLEKALKLCKTPRARKR
jgi:hypothetical protein